MTPGQKSRISIDRIARSTEKDKERERETKTHRMGLL